MTFPTEPTTTVFAVHYTWRRKFLIFAWVYLLLFALSLTAAQGIAFGYEQYFLIAVLLVFAPIHLKQNWGILRGKPAITVTDHGLLLESEQTMVTWEYLTKLTLEKRMQKLRISYHVTDLDHQHSVRRHFPKWMYKDEATITVSPWMIQESFELFVAAVERLNSVERI